MSLCFCLGIDSCLYGSEFVVLLQTVATASYVVGGPEEKHIAAECKKDRRHFVEAVPHGKDIYHTLSAAYQYIVYTLVGGCFQITAAVVEYEYTTREVCDTLEASAVWVEDVPLDAREVVTVGCRQVVLRIVQPLGSVGRYYQRPLAALRQYVAE